MGERLLENRSLVTSWYTAEAQYLEGFSPRPTHLTVASFLEQDDVNVIMDALEEQLALKGDHFPFLGCLQGAHQSLEDVGATVVVEEHAELYAGLTVGI